MIWDFHILVLVPRRAPKCQRPGMAASSYKGCHKCVSLGSGVENWTGFALRVKGATRFNQGTAGIVCFIQVNLFEVREI